MSSVVGGSKVSSEPGSKMSDEVSSASASFTIEKLVVIQGYDDDDVKLTKSSNKKPKADTIDKVQAVFERAGTKQSDLPTLQASDVILLRQLQQNYDTQMEDQQMQTNCRRLSMRQAALVAVTWMIALQTAVAAVIVHVADASWAEGFCFVTYSVTSAGFGHVVIPFDSNGFLAFAIIYMYVGISSFAIMVRTCER